MARWKLLQHKEWALTKISHTVFLSCVPVAVEIFHTEVQYSVVNAQKNYTLQKMQHNTKAVLIGKTSQNCHLNTLVIAVPSGSIFDLHKWTH